MPALQRPDRFSTGAFSSLPPAFSSPQEFAAWAAVSAEAVPASRLPEEECAALDARPPEVFAAARVEPQAVDHSVLVAESHESAPDDFPVESARACSVVPPVADSSPDDSELLPAGWLAESARACSVVPPVADSSLDDSDLLPAGWQVESVRVCSVVPPVADSSLDDSELSPAGWQVESARVCSVVPPVADSSLDDSELLPAGWQAESARACSAVLALGGLARAGGSSEPGQGFSRMRGQGLLLFRKRYGLRRWSLLGDDLPVRNCRWWRSHVTCGRSFRSQYAFARWSHSNSSTQRRRCDLLRAYLNPRLRHGLCAGECVLRNHHHRTLDIPVRVSNVCDVCCGVVNNRRVINVGHLSDVHGRIADIDSIHISFAHAIRRHIDFPRT